MKELSVIIVEDDLIHQSNARSLCKKLDLEVLGLADNHYDALALILRYKPKLILVDIMLKEGTNGLDLIADVRAHYQPLAIVTTSQISSEFVSKAAQAGIQAYLAKPLRLDDLQTSILLAIENTRLLNKSSDFILLKHAKGTDRVALDSIVYLSTAGNRYCVYFCSEKEYRMRTGLQEAFEALPKLDFIRVHKSYVVRLNTIQTLLASDILLLKNGTQIPIGEAYKKELLERLST